MYHQTRAFSWAFWRKPEPQVSEELVEPSIDVELVDSIVQMAGPSNMDSATWAAIYSETNWPNIWVAESMLASAHDALGVSWMVALPATVALMRTVMSPMHIIALREGHKMAKANPLIQDAQKAMMLSMERGASTADAQVLFCYVPLQVDIYSPNFTVGTQMQQCHYVTCLLYTSPSPRD